MYVKTAKRLIIRRFSVLLSTFVVVVLGMTSSALATCGDYLVHGKIVHLEHNAHDAMQEANHTASHLIFRNQPLTTSSKPISACEGGRCQSKPVPPPVDSTRISIPKHLATVSVIDDLCEGKDCQWSRPSDGIAAEQPFLAIASPPPRRFFLCA